MDQRAACLAVDLVADAAGAILFFTGLASGTGGVAALGFGTYALAPPIIHFAHGKVGVGFADLGLLPRAVSGRVLFWGLTLQWAFALLVLRVPAGEQVLSRAGDAVNSSPTAAAASLTMSSTRRSVASRCCVGGGSEASIEPRLDSVWRTTATASALTRFFLPA